jgi:hypothetical protein
MDAPVTDPEITNPNPHGLTFPYPLIGVTNRPRGQGCLSCVHRTYCPAVYWFNRYTQENLTEDSGRACASWSDNPADKATVVAQADLDENEYIYNQGIGSEANRNGITAPVTGNAGKY